MPVTIKVDQIKYKNGQGQYIGANAVSERTTAEQVAAVQAAGASTISEVEQAVSDSQAAVDSLESQKNTIAQTVASMAQLGTDTTLTTPGMAADAKATGDECSALKSAIQQISDPVWGSKAAGIARKVISDQYATDNAPYNFRQAFDADWNEDKLIGGTVAWNQQIKKSILQPTTTISGVTFTNNGDGSITVSGTATETIYYTVRSALTYPVRKYILMGCPSGGSKETYSLRMRGQGIDYYDMGNGCVWNSAGNQYKGVCIAIQSGTVISTPITFKPNLIDISQVFGVEIANAIFAMEQSVSGVGNGVGTAWFKKLFPKDYYAEDTGSLQSVQAASHVMRGKNLFDENAYLNLTTQYEFIVNNYRIKSIKLQPFTKYTVSIRGVADSGIVILMNNKKAINSMPYFDLRHGVDQITFTTNETGELYIGCSSSNADAAYNARLLACKVQIEVGDTKSDYVPYESPHTYSLGNVELRGIPKIDGNGNLYYDGDEYQYDGTVTRRYGIVDLGTLTWTKNGNVFSADLSDAKESIGSNGMRNAICTRYGLASTGSALYTGSEDKAFLINSTYLGPQGKAYIGDSAYSSGADLKASLNGVYLVYELATPTTETTDPFEIAQDVFYDGTEEYVDRAVTAETPTRDVAIPVGHESKYYKDYRREMNAKLSASQKLMELIITSNRENSMKATKAYSTGDLLIVSGTLYKATTSIANGATLTVGTNVTATTVASELASLA